jgi:D-glycero-D-manno-heptose 1,7-bisphosphate phosphatase
MTHAQKPSLVAPRRAVFLDRDGTLNVERVYLSDPAQLVLLPGVPGALARLQAAGFLLFVVTNQSGIGRGYYTEADMHAVNQRLQEVLAPHGVRFARIYFAPEAPGQPSHGRKPSPRFLFNARDDFGLDLGRSYLVGDKLADLQCGWNAGVKASVLVRTGYGAEVERKHPAEVARAWVVDDLAQAVPRLLSDG